MTRLRRVLHGTLVSVWLVAWWPVAVEPAQVPDHGDRVAAIEMFESRVDRYVALRERLEAPLPSFDTHRGDWSLALTRCYLGSAIRTARAGARLGDIFLPSGAVFRSAIEQAAGEAHVRGLIDHEFHPAEVGVELVVNEPVPAWAQEPLPDALIERLPALPEAIEYRIVGDSLILWDSHAGILIDALPGAFLPR